MQTQIEEGEGFFSFLNAISWDLKSVGKLLVFLEESTWEFKGWGHFLPLQAAQLITVVCYTIIDTITGLLLEECLPIHTLKGVLFGGASRIVCVKFIYEVVDDIFTTCLE